METGESWNDLGDGSCVDHETPDLWHMLPYQRAGDPRTLEAKKICNDCPVREQCLDYAYDIGDRDSVMGGLTPKERAEAEKWAAQLEGVEPIDFTPL